MTQTVDASNPELEKTKLELRLLNQKLGSIPELGLQQFRMYRNIFIQSKILEVLVPVYEQTRLEEKKEVPSVVVLDRAVPAERKTKPKRMLIVLISTLSAAFLTLSMYAAWEQIVRLRTSAPREYEVLQSLFRFKRS